MRMRNGAILIGLGLLIIAGAGCPPSPPAGLTQVANWGVGSLAPTVFPASTQVMMTPVVMNLGHPGGLAQVAFISFDSATFNGTDTNGVLRVIDIAGKEIACFPDPSKPVAIPPSCVAAYPNLNVTPHLSPLSGLAIGTLDASGSAEIIGVLDDHSTNNGGIIAFRLVGGALIPEWCSQQLPAGDIIPISSAPAIAQLDDPNSTAGQQSEVIIDNKVYDYNGKLRYTGFSAGSGNCASSATGGSPCPRSRVVVVANLYGGNSLPQVITGRGIYQSTSTTFWTGPLSVPSLILNPNITNPNFGEAYPAVADLDNSPGPEIVVSDAQAAVLRVLSPIGVQLAQIPIPNNSSAGCTSSAGGPPMIGDADPALPGPEIGVASCTNYTLFKYNAGTLTQLWSVPISDSSGRTTSTLYNTSAGARIYYADSNTLWVFDGQTGTALQSLPNSSGTVFEGPVIASFDTGLPGSNSPHAPGRLIVAANNYSGGGQQGVRIFTDTEIGQARPCWNQHTYHVTNIKDCFGNIPVAEPPNWLSPSPNTFRVQQQ